MYEDAHLEAAYEERYESELGPSYDEADDYQDEEPDEETLEEWSFDGVAEATDGCTVELDGHCPHGKPSWFLALGMI